MKYKYKPNCSIIDYKRVKKMFEFDENGEFETNDPKLIKWIKENKNFLKPVTQTTEQPKPEEKIYQCKKCDFTTTNMGELLAHYRNDHPKK